MRPRRAWALAALIVGVAVCDLEAQPPPALFPITVDDKHGMIDRAGTVVIPPEYAEPSRLARSLYRRHGPRRLAEPVASA